MRRFAALEWLLVACVLLLALSTAAPPAAATTAGHDPANPYRQVRIAWPEVTARAAAIQDLGLEVMGIERDTWVDFLCRSEELEQLDAAGVPYRVVVPDLEQEYAGRYRDPGFGMFHTYSEMVEFLDQLHATYPGVTTDKIQIGASWEGRAQWAMKISDDPGFEDPDEPEVLIDGVHHAREIMALEVPLYFMNWLCENYGTDPEATQLVDSRQIWFVPVVNPDGFVYNEQTNPNGGGMWRKNRRNDQGACIGVDLNRNYPYQWGGSGSSGDPCSETYRGTIASSEFETASMIGFINQHEFVTHDSFHSVAGMVLFPWGYTSQHTPDDALLRAIAGARARDSGYEIGTPPDILYVVSGGMFDWTYGEQGSKPKIFSFSTEVGGSGFWPAESEWAGLVAENLYSNIVLVRAAGVWLALDGFAVNGGNGNGRLDPGETAELVVTVANIGAVAQATGVTVTLASDDPYLALAGASGTIGTIDAGATGDNGGDPFSLTADAATPAGHRADLRVSMADDAGFATTETLTLVIGQAPVVYSQDFEAGSDWEQDATHTASTGAFIRDDPVPTTYQPGDDTTPPPGVNAWFTGQNPTGQVGTDDVDGGISATHSPLLDLSGLASARLDMNWFHGQRDAGDDPSGDFFRIEVSNDGGATYPASLMAIGDVAHAAAWQSLVVDLEDALPLTASMRIRVQASDGPSAGDIVEAGVDDVTILDNGSGNDAPGAPLLVSPPNGAGGQPAAPALVVENAVDPEGDPLTYTFRVYGDALLTQEVRAVTGVAEGGGGTTSWTVAPELANGAYYWRAHAADPELRGPYMAAASFTVTGGTSAVADGREVVPGAAVALASPAPNPFSAGTLVSYSLPARARVRLDIFDVGGRHVRRLLEGAAEAGLHVRRWDGLATDGSRAPAGIYLVQLEVDGRRQTQKLIRLP